MINKILTPFAALFVVLIILGISLEDAYNFNKRDKWLAEQAELHYKNNI